MRGISRTVCVTPVVGADQHLYVAGWAAGGDKESPIRLEPFEETLRKVDKNSNNKIDDSELTEGPVKQRFTQIDRDNDNALSQAEYDYFRQLFELGKNLVLAIKPGPVGDTTETHVVWRNDRSVPFCASPLFYQDRLYTVKDGGIVSSLDAKTGKLLKQARINATGSYYCSPIAADGKVLLLSQKGVLTILNTEDPWKAVHSADFGEECYGTPAIVGGRLFLRTEGHLYCFGGPDT